jgi:DNA-directed RNA polymerase specialized sigma24 family protein
VTWRQHSGGFDNPINPELEQEARLVDQARAGSERAFSALLARYQQPVFRLIFYLVGDADEARTLTRIALKHALSRMPRVPAGYSIRPWLLRVATLVALDAVRERNESPQALIASLQLPEPQPPTTPRIVDADPTLSETMELSITKLDENPDVVIADAWDSLPLEIERELVRRLLANLPESDAELLALGVVGQLPTRDLAALSGTSQRSIRRRIARALILFQSHYQLVRQEALPPAPLPQELPEASISGITALDAARRGINEATERVKRGWRTVRASLGSVEAQEHLQTLRSDESPAPAAAPRTKHPTRPASPPPQPDRRAAIAAEPTVIVNAGPEPSARDGIAAAQTIITPLEVPIEPTVVKPKEIPVEPTVIKPKEAVAETTPQEDDALPDMPDTVVAPPRPPTIDDLAVAVRERAVLPGDETTIREAPPLPPDIAASDTVVITEPLDVTGEPTMILREETPPSVAASDTLILTPEALAAAARRLPRYGPPPEDTIPEDEAAPPVIPEMSADTQPEAISNETVEAVTFAADEEDVAVIADVAEEPVVSISTQEMDIPAEPITADAESSEAAPEPVVDTARIAEAESMAMAAEEGTFETATEAAPDDRAEEAEAPDAVGPTMPKPADASAEEAEQVAEELIPATEIVESVDDSPSASAQPMGPEAEEISVSEAPTLAYHTMPRVQDDVTRPAPRLGDKTVIMSDTDRREYMARHQVTPADLGDLGGIQGVALHPENVVPDEELQPVAPPPTGVMNVAPASSSQAEQDQILASLAEATPDATLVVKPPTPSPAEPPQMLPVDLADLSSIVARTVQPEPATEEDPPRPPQRSRRPTRPMPRLERDAPEKP